MANHFIQGNLDRLEKIFQDHIIPFVPVEACVVDRVPEGIRLRIGRRDVVINEALEVVGSGYSL